MGPRVTPRPRHPDGLFPITEGEVRTGTPRDESHTFQRSTLRKKPSILQKQNCVCRRIIRMKMSLTTNPRGSDLQTLLQRLLGNLLAMLT
jgi:hypothetical protein